jgi:hypothetical protein
MEMSRFHSIPLGLAITILVSGCSMFHTMKPRYRAQLSEELKRQAPPTPDILTEERVQKLPVTIQRYLAYTGSIGRPLVTNFKATFKIEMRTKPGARPMKAESEQYNFLEQPTRLFYMQASMFGIPADGLHSYRDEKATMTVRVASLFNAVDASGPVLDKTETVTILNDYCLLAPAVLIDPRFRFHEIDTQSTQVIFRNGSLEVSAVLHFGKAGELINFVSNDRSALQSDGTFKQFRFSTPIGSYREIAGRRVPAYGEAAYQYPEGEFTYGKFWLRSIEYNVKSG